LNELIKIKYENDNPTVSGRDLHEFLEIGTEYMKWFERMTEYGFGENHDYIVFVKNDDNRLGGRPSTDHALTLDMAKEICMIQRSEKGKQARQYFIEIEKKYTQQSFFKIPQTYSEALRLAAEQAETIESQNRLLEEQKVKVEFFDQVTDSTDAIDIGSAAKVLNNGMGRNDLFKFLRKKRVLMHDNQPYQEFIDKSYFRVIEQKYTKPDGSIAINIKTLVYQKGLDYIRRLCLSL